MSRSYERKTYLRPYWEGGRIENESVLPLLDEDGGLAPISLMYPARRICEVRSADLGRLFCEGKDYELSEGRLRILPGGEIPVMTREEFFPAEPAEGKSFPCTLGGHIFFAEGASMHVRQLAVSYEAEGEWEGPVPAPRGADLPRTLAALKQGRPLRVLIYGDSISTGANSSKMVKAEPYAETWFDMLVGELSEHYGCEIELVNTAVGGKSSPWGAENAVPLAADKQPDLAIIGFGMNDGTGRIPPEKFGENMRIIRQAILEQKPECEFILISTMMPHAIVGRFLGLQEQYLPVLLSMEQEGTVVANVTDVHKHLMSRKRYFDMTGNNVNHPNDFLARLYAQVLYRTLQE